jgi:NAD+ synthase (glutamine-hydrolysing)
MRILLGQINPTIGDFEGNTQKILRVIEHAREKKVDVVAFPEIVSADISQKSGDALGIC